jgi:hypothetical protein
MSCWECKIPKRLAAILPLAYMREQPFKTKQMQTCAPKSFITPKARCHRLPHA